MSSTTPPKARKARASGRERVWRLNLRALVILSAGALLSVGALVVALLLRPGPDPQWVNRARQQIEAGQAPLALSFLNEAIRRNPRDVEALDLKADLLAQAARDADDLSAAIQLSEQALRLDPEGPRSQELRRRLVGLHLRVAPWQAEPKLRFEVADLLARELIERSPEDAEAIRLRARVQEGLAEQGQDAEALDQAIALYEQARRLEPDQIAGVERLAWLYRSKKDDAQRGRLVLDELLEARGDSAGVRLARHRFQAALARDAEARDDRSAARKLWEEADSELEHALALAPERAEVRLQAADYHLRRGRPEAARRQIAALPESARQDPRARALEGLAHLQQNQTSQAIDDWRQGLVESNGTDGELTWRLAFVLLQSGRLEEAAPLIEQFRRLDGREEPSSAYLLLKGIEQLRRNQPAEALKPLQQARRGAPEELIAQLEFATGQCFEALRDPAQALEHYQRATEADPRLVAPQLARVRLIQGRRPEEARQEIRQALDRLGEEPGLLVNLARLEFRDQLHLPESRRDWTEVRQLIERTSRVAPAAAGLIQLQADLLRAEGHLEEASELLEQASQHRKGDVEIWLARALLLQQRGQLPTALAVLEQAMAPGAAGDQAPLRIARARLLSLQGRGQEAREQLVANLEELPSDQRPDVWKALGDLHAEQRHPEEARRAYEQWADALPDDPLPRLFLLELALDDDDRPAVDEQIARLKQISGEDGLYWRIARVQELFRAKAGESDEAAEVRLREAETLITAIEAESRQERFGPMLRGQLAELRGQKAEAAAAFEDALQRDGGPIALRQLVRLYQELGRQADLSRLRREHAQELPAIDRELAEAAFQRGDHDEAVQLAQRVVQEDPEGLETRVWQGRLLSASGKPEEALASLRELVAKQPDQIGPRLALVLFLAGQGQAEAAREAVEQIIQEVKNLDQPEFTFAQCWRLAGDRDRADEAFRAALAKWPDDPRVLREAVSYFENSDRTAEAERLLREAQKRAPAWPWVTRTLALLRSNHPGDPDAWREAWTLIGEEGGPNESPEDRLARGIILARGPEASHQSQAVAILGPLLEDLPADVPTAGVARSVLRQLYLRDGQPAEAARVAAIDARAPDARPEDLIRSAELFLAAEQPDEAEPFIQRLEAESPDPIAPVLLRAQLLKLRGQIDQAAALLLETFEAQAVATDDLAAGYRLFETLSAIDPKVAETLAQQLVAARPHLAWLQADARARQGAVGEALDLYRDAVANAEPADLRAIARGVVTLALEAASAEDSSEVATLLNRADEALNAALDREPQAIDLRLARAGLRHAQGRYAEEIQIYEAVLRENPPDRSFLNNMAWTLCEALDQPEKALQWINLAIDQAPSVPPQFYDTRGVILTRLGRFDEAIADLERASQGPTRGPALAHLARAYHQADRPDAFQATLERIRAVRLRPEDLEPRDRRELLSLLFGDAASGRP